MRSWRGPLWVAFLCFVIHARGQGDFDLADALDDPEPTKKPSSDIYPKPKPPAHPQPGNPDSGGNIYPRPKPPPPRPQPGHSDNSGGYYNDMDHNDGRYPPRPRPRPPAGGGGYNPGYDGYGNSHGGGRYRPDGYSHGAGGHSTYGDPHGNTVAKIVSPIVSVLVVTLVGTAVGYFQRNRRRSCFRRNEPENV